MSMPQQAQRQVKVTVPAGLNTTTVLAAAGAAAQATVDRMASSNAISNILENSNHPPSRLLLAAISDREQRWRDLEAAHGLYNSAEVHDLAGSTAKNPYEWASSRYRAGKLIAATRRGRLMFPGFQFDPESGKPWPMIPELARLFRNAGWSDNSVIQWCAAANGYLGGTAPADILGTRPAEVLDAARSVIAPW